MSDNETVAYCPSCKVEVTESKVSLEKDSLLEHTVCGTDIWASEDLVIKSMAVIGISN